MSDNELTAEQEKAIAKIKKAIEHAYSIGLRIYAMSDSLVAYKNEPFDKGRVAEKHTAYTGMEVPYWTITGITDSGADDPYYYKQ